jgi:hypothetical protein
MSKSIQERLISLERKFRGLCCKVERGEALSYRVYTALLTQSGGDGQQTISSGDLTIGVTYKIIDASSGDWTNVGAPSNKDGIYFVATGITPNFWDGVLEYNTGAPVVTVLENTIGNIWFIYKTPGVYSCASIDLFIQDKTYSTPYDFYEKNLLYNNCVRTQWLDTATIDILTVGIGSNSHDNGLVSTTFEIRVYN